MEDELQALDPAVEPDIGAPPVQSEPVELLHELPASAPALPVADLAAAPEPAMVLETATAREAAPVSAEAVRPPETAAVSNPRQVTEAAGPEPIATAAAAWQHMAGEVLSGLQTLISPALFATLIVTFGF